MPSHVRNIRALIHPPKVCHQAELSHWEGILKESRSVLMVSACRLGICHEGSGSDSKCLGWSESFWALVSGGWNCRILWAYTIITRRAAIPSFQCKL